ncbi:MAG TPA: LamG domain-containing protein [Solirubrobacterales bacterium]|nr:LamG domain-containing protein [Solirubrobacterales bacterium]
MAARPYRDAVIATAGLVSLWELSEEEGSAGDQKDSNVGSYNGSPSRAQASILPNGEGRCVRFTPTTQFVGIADAPNLDVGDAFTLEAWIKPNTVNANRGIISKGNKGYYLRVNATGKLELLKSQTSVIVAATEALAAGTAYHVVATKTGATVKLYVNGADKTGAVTNAAVEDNANSLNIGGDTGFATERFDGWVQFAAVYNAALSAGIVASHKGAAEQAVTASAGAPLPLSQRTRVVFQ